VGDFPSLVRLDVSNNSMRFLPASMGNFRKIQRIDVSNNMLSR
jgi:Leucine-rich repeat (LRR) protein